MRGNRGDGLTWLLSDRESISPADIVAAVETVLGDPGYRARAQAAGQELRARWHSGVAVTLLERLAETGAPVTEPAL